MKIFIDTANLQEIEAGLKRGFISGVTTNPALLAKEPKTKFESHVQKIITLVKRYDGKMPISIEVFSQDKDEMIRQALHFKKTFKYPHLSVKVQIGWNDLEVVSALAKKGIQVNCTACMTPMQALMAAQAGARYVSLFWGRIRDAATDPKFKAVREQMLKDQVLDKSDFDPAQVVAKTRKLLDASGLKAEIITGSIRSVVDIRDAALAGSHIVTVPPKFFNSMASHFKTTEVIEQFLSAFDAWMKK